MTKKKKHRAGAWIDAVGAAVGRFVHLETSDGSSREGKLTGLRTREIIMDGTPVEMPIAIELNGDPNDFIDFVSIYRFDID